MSYIVDTTTGGIRVDAETNTHYKIYNDAAHDFDSHKDNDAEQ